MTFYIHYLGVQTTSHILLLNPTSTAQDQNHEKKKSCSKSYSPNMEERKEEKKKKLNLKSKIYHLFRFTVKSSTCSLSSRNLPISVQNPVFFSSYRHQSNNNTSSSSLFNLHRSLSLPYFSDHHHQQQTGLFCLANELKKKEDSRDDKSKRRHIKKKKLCSNPYGFTTTSSESDDGDIDDDGFFSSDEREDEGAETLFSSRSFSSDSSDFYYNSSRSGKKRGSRRRRLPPRRGRSRRGRGRQHMIDDGFRPLVSVSSRNLREKITKEVVEEKRSGGGDNGVAVVRESEDPYADFRISMLEMIVENQIFGRKDLDELLRSYLSLNSPDHHPIILNVFSDICEVLFCN